ncbi:MAG: S-layer homology domain-containing protein [Thermosynechococcaceae cyanobacterium MS004]|nr:S-layer homology domain-containing protein [Thermosynechococcaceae cyanobacterium MS004]
MTYFLNRAFKVSAVMMVGSSLGAAVFPGALMTSAIAQSASFSDVSSDYWARPFIETLAEEEIIAGFPDGTFKPRQAVTRAQFAAIIRKAFSRSSVVRNSRDFKDVRPSYWAAPSIDKAFTTGFLSGYPDGTFLPEQNIPKAQAIISLASGLKLDPPSSIDSALSVYRDAGDIPDYARNGVAAATQRTLVVNYPNVAFLNPNEIATRADVAAFVYQALVNQGRLSALPAQSNAIAYIVNGGGAQVSPPVGEFPSGPGGERFIARGTVLPVRFSGGSNAKLILATTDTLQANFEVSEPIVNQRGRVLIPLGSQVQGRFQPININNTTQGTQYFADRLLVNGVTYPINLVSDPIFPTAPQSLSTNTLQGGLATVAAQLLLGRVLGGGVNLGSILGGVLGGTNNAGLGGIIGGGNPISQSSNVVIVEPSRLVLRFQSDTQVASNRVDLR